MEYTNKHNLPDPVVKALTSYDKPQSVQGLRVTTLIDSPRVSQLRIENSRKITEDVSEMVWRVLGTAIHEIFEKAASNAYVSEERLSHTVNGTLISGAIDYQFEDDGEVDLKDYKSTSAFKVTLGDHDDWERQLNVYAYLIRHQKGLSVRSASIIAVLRDWRQAEVDRKEGYPSAPIVEIPIKLWPEDEQDSYVEERVRLHRVAQLERGLAPLAPCTPAERWARNETWAVHTGKAKRATKLFPSEEAAQKFANQSSNRRVVHRPATFARCEGNYCKVNRWCDQYKGEVE